MRTILIVAAALFASISISPNVNAAITIDDYTAGNTLSQFGVGTKNSMTVDVSILGNQRMETLTVTAQAGNEFFGAMGFTGEMDVAQGSSDQIIGGVSYSNFGTLDLTEGGINDVFELGFISSDIDAALTDVVSITVTSGASMATRQITVPANSSLPQDLLVSFSHFAGVDMTAVDSVSLDFDFTGNPGRDFELGLFSARSSAVPEPAALLIMGLGLFAFIGLQRRRN